MASGFSTVTANDILAVVYKETAYPLLGEIVYIGVSLTEIFPDGSGITEPIDPAYVRIPCTKDTWTDPSDGVISNLTPLQFGLASQDWGVLSWFFQTTSSSGITTPFINFAPLSTPREVKAGDVLVFPIGNVSLRILNGGLT